MSNVLKTATVYISTPYICTRHDEIHAKIVAMARRQHDNTGSRLITSAEEGGYVFGSVCLSVCLSVCPSDYSQTCERIFTKFFGGVGHGSRTK